MQQRQAPAAQAPVSSTLPCAATAAAAYFQRRRCCDTTHIRNSSFSSFSVGDCAAASSTILSDDGAVSSASPTMQSNSAVSVASFSMRQRQRGFGLSFLDIGSSSALQQLGPRCNSTACDQRLGSSSALQHRRQRRMQPALAALCFADSATVTALCSYQQLMLQRHAAVTALRSR